MALPDGLLALIGNTPILELKGFDTGPCQLFLKLENQNPGGSIKDRIGLSMIEAAEREGKLLPGGKLIEATAGNTGLALALVAAARGYHLTLVLPDKMSQEKVQHLKALGVEIVMTRSDVGKGHPAYYQDMAARIAEETGAYYVNQFANPANPAAHELTTGPELFAQMDGRVDAVLAGVGSGGTMTGLARFFERVSPHTEMVLGDPQGSILADYVNKGSFGEAGSWLVEGMGEDFIPPQCDLSRVKKVYTITDKESFDTARALLLKTGIFGGSSTGLLVAAALRYCREQTSPKRVATFVCDSGNKYLSKMYNDYWMTDQGLLEREAYGDLRDLIARRHSDRAVVTVGPDEPLTIAYGRMKLYDVSQLPVLEGERVVGILDEEDLLLAIVADQSAFRRPVRGFMTSRLQTFAPTTQVAELVSVLHKGMVAIVVEGDRFLGLVTRIDLLNYLRRKLR